MYPVKHVYDNSTIKQDFMFVMVLSESQEKTIMRVNWNPTASTYMPLYDWTRHIFATTASLWCQ